VIELPAPILETHEGIVVVRDDLLPGGTKRRAIPIFFDDAHDTYVYASPVQGAAQLALAYTAREYGKKAVIFCAERKTKHPNTLRAIQLGAYVREVPMGFLSNVSAKARDFCEQTGAKLLPFGLDDPLFIEALAAVARNLPQEHSLLRRPPTEVWSITSSGVLTRALQLAWPDAKFFGVRVGHPPDAGSALVYDAPEKFEQPAKRELLPPFASCLHYDAKAWRFVKRLAHPGALFWNVSA
jgi:hypothetical protein